MKIAIYSRKSKFTGKGDSIGNQIDRCKDYINFIFMEEKNIEIEIFEDEGYSGKNTDRPAFKKMMHMIKMKNHIQFSPVGCCIRHRLIRAGMRCFSDCHNVIFAQYFPVHLLQKLVHSRTACTSRIIASVGLILNHRTIRISRIFGNQCDHIHTESVNSLVQPEA